jgi:hypothetical protein
MNDQRFIELVNLYIDRQISAEETAELEAELQVNPRRRAIYRQYCQLHTASKQVYAGFRSQAPAAPAGAPTGRVIRAEFNRRRRPHWIHYAGGLAAAACLAIAFVRYNSEAAPADAANPSANAPMAVATATPVAPAVVPPQVVPVEAVAKEPNSELLRALRQEEQRALAAGQIQPGRLPSLFDDGVFEVRPGMPANNQRVFRGKQTPEAQFTAFEFQR